MRFFSVVSSEWRDGIEKSIKHYTDVYVIHIGRYKAGKDKDDTNEGHTV
jgi:hypothetical protein